MLLSVSLDIMNDLCFFGSSVILLSTIESFIKRFSSKSSILNKRDGQSFSLFAFYYNINSEI